MVASRRKMPSSVPVTTWPTPRSWLACMATTSHCWKKSRPPFASPIGPLALGRKSFPPGESVWLEGAICQEGLRDALLAWPRLVKLRPGQLDVPLRLVLEHESAGAVRLDQPVAPFAQRRFGPRYVASEAVHVPL